MPKVTFKAKAGLPKDKGGKRWLHKKGGKKFTPSNTYHLVEPVYFEDGKAYEVTDAEAASLLAHFPECFSIKAEVKAKSKKSESPEEVEE